MKIDERKKTHEEYHKNIKSHNKIISDNNFTYIHILPVINRYIKSGMRVLDIGCGSGTLVFYLASKQFDVTGIDISKKAIYSCNQSAANLGFKNVKFFQSKFPDEKINKKFDFIIFSEVLEHLENDALALREINRLLNKNGILLLTTPSENAPLHRLGFTKKFDKEVGHLRRYDKKKLSVLLSKSGFKIKFIKTCEGPLRNFLFVNPVAGKFIKVLKFVIADIFTLIDDISSDFFGGSDIILVARKTLP